MKSTITLIIASIPLLYNTGYTYAQNDEREFTNMLTEFYTTYDLAWSKNENNLTGRLDSLQQKYCTKKFNKRLKKMFEAQGVDDDLFTKDYGTDKESIKTLLITKNPAENYIYTVSYIVNTEDSTNKKLNKKFKSV
ncbi:MAG: hypothetical protein PUB21_09595 [Bacteroidales bacterium]|nr:hypothetical protein [Bacteroidales bacterium]